MITYLLYAAVSLCVVVFQTTLAMHFALIGGMYDLFLLVIIYVGFYRPIQEGFPLVLILGVVMDGMSGGPFGLYLTAYFWLYICILLLTRFMRVGNPLMLPLVVAGSVIFQNFTFLGTIAVFIPGAMIPTFSYRNIFMQLIGAVITGPVLILFFRRMHQAMEKWLKSFEPEYR